MYVTRTGFTAIVSVEGKFYDETLIGWIDRSGNPKAYPYRFRISISDQFEHPQPTFILHPAIRGRSSCNESSRKITLSM